MKNQKATINLKYNDDKCFQYAVTVASNYKNIKNNFKKISKLKHSLNNYNWKEIRFPPHKNQIRLGQIINQLLLMFCLLKLIRKK